MTTVVSVAQGGTGANSAALARTALGVPPSAAYDQANTARAQANTAYGQANSAYGAANTRLSASGGTLAGDLIITGNLTVSGNSTTLNTEVLTVEDADVVLLSNVASTPALNAGIIVNRGTSTNTFLRWDEVTDKWGWSDDGSTTYKFTSALDAYAAANNRVLKSGDTMTGQLNVSSGGLLVTGNVGIGTTNPQGKLTISNAGAEGIEFFTTGGSGGGPYFNAYNRSAEKYVPFTYYANTHTFYANTGSTRAMDIVATGYVGIGTSNPANRLHVTNGSVGSNVSNSIIHAEISGARHHLDFKEIRTSNTSDWNATTYKLQMRVDSTNHQSIDFVSDSSYNEHIDIYTGNQIFNTRFHQNGNVGIGNTAPASKLTVAGTIESTTGGVKFPDGTTQTTAASAAADPIPSGTVMLFVQTAAPTGWTKSTTHNDKALRVVSGSVSTGGSVAFTSAFASQSVAGSISSTTQGGSVSTSVSGSVSGSVGSTTLSTSEMPSHGHSVTDNGVGVTVYDSSVAGGGPYGSLSRAATQSAGAGLTINSTGGGGSHNHSWSGSFSGSASSTFTGSSHGHTFTGTAINLAVQYVDVIIATKN